MELRPYQIEALGQMRATGRFIYGDAPGTGKTATTLRWLAETGVQRALIVTPMNVLHHWEAEAAKWYPELIVIDGRGTKAWRVGQRVMARSMGGLDGPTALLLNYESMRQDIEHLVDLQDRFDTLVCDEAHRLKGRSTQTHKAAVKIARRVEHLALVTGTPILNRADECWSSLNMIDPREWSSFWRWARAHFEVTTNDFGGRAPRPVTIVGALRDGHDDVLRDEIGEYLIQRPIEQLLPDMPDVTETELLIDFSREERRVYDSMAKKLWMDLGGVVTIAKNKVTQITRLRQLASDWSSIDPNVETAGAKVKAAADLIDDLAPEQVVVLTSYKAAAYQLYTLLNANAAIFTGDQAHVDRQVGLTDFVSGEVPVLIGTHAALGEGVDGLQVARHIVLLDQDWTPARNEQAIARVRRSGQAADAICVYRIIVKDTIDQTVAEALERKEAVIDAIIGQRYEDVVAGRLAA